MKIIVCFSCMYLFSFASIAQDEQSLELREANTLFAKGKDKNQEDPDFWGGKNSMIPGHIAANKVSYLGAHNINTSTKRGWYYAQQSETPYDLLTKYQIRYMKFHVHWFLPSDSIKKVTTAVKGLLTGGKKSHKPKPYLALCHERPPKNCQTTLLLRGGKDPEPAINLLKEINKAAAENPKELYIARIEGFPYSFVKKSGTEKFDEEMVINSFNALLEESGLASRAYVIPTDDTYRNVETGEIDRWPPMSEFRKGKNVVILGANGYQDSEYANDFKVFMNQMDFEAPDIAKCKLLHKNSKTGLYRFGNYPLASLPNENIIGKAVSAASKVKEFITGSKLIIGKEHLTGVDYSKANDESKAWEIIDRCKAKYGDVQGIVVDSDFSHKGNLKNVVDSLNKELVAREKK